MQRGSENNDYSAAVISPRGCSDQQLARIKAVLEEAGQDRNGDGAVIVKIKEFRFAIGEDGQDRIEIAGLDADLVGKESGIFFTEDPERFETVTNGIGKASNAIPVRDIPQFSECGINDLYMIVRSDTDKKYTELQSALSK